MIRQVISKALTAAAVIAVPLALAVPASAATSESLAASVASDHWGSARIIPLTARGSNGGGRIEAIACASRGNCTAGGSYVDHAGNWQVFVVSEVNGSWGKPRAIPGLNGTSSDDELTHVLSLSCPTAGDCAAAGSIGNSDGGQ